MLCGKSSYLRAFACTRSAHARRGRFAVSTVPDLGSLQIADCGGTLDFFVFFVLILEETALVVKVRTVQKL